MPVSAISSSTGSAQAWSGIRAIAPGQAIGPIPKDDTTRASPRTSSISRWTSRLRRGALLLIAT
jgi:hypothetical protein